MRYSVRSIVFACASILALSSATPGQERDARLENFETELVVETGNRTAPCDVLTFTPDGKYLMATGDDKVVRVWPFSARAGLDLNNVDALRWSIFRQQRGSIYTMAFDKKAEKIAIGGYGIRFGSVAVLDRDGNVLAGVTPKNTPNISGSTIWSMAFAPSGKTVAFGSADGGVYAWEPDRKGSHRRLGTHPGREGQTGNKVKFVHFESEGQLLSVAEDGWVCEWDPKKADGSPTKRFRFGVTDLFGAAIDPTGKWIAAYGQNKNARVVEVKSLDGARNKELTLPDGLNFPRCLAFDPKGQKLAVGYYTIPDGATFYKIKGGGVMIYDLTDGGSKGTRGPRSTYYPEALAYHPDGKHLAVAGGNDHEVTVWSTADFDKPVSRAAGPGSCLWGVGISADGRQLGVKVRREENPGHPNAWGAGPWQVFDLFNRKWAKPGEVQNFEPVKPIEKAGGWEVEFAKGDGYTWYVVKGEKRFKLPLEARIDAMPRCYTFLETSPTRLVVGHYWGMSVFELRDNGPVLVRKFVGHQGEVMSVAPTKNQKMLVTASRDQTVAFWRLTPWSNQSELGARFIKRGNKVIVDDVNAGSPAWEARMQKGDEIVLFAYAGKEVKEGADKWLEILANPKPGVECYFRMKRAGEEKPIDLLTTVRQRPLYCFFPVQGKEWVMWVYHTPYYDTSTNGDFYIGWQLSGDVDKKPNFDRAEQFRKRFHKPEKLVGFLRGTEEPERVSILAIEPPMVELKASTTKTENADVKVKLTASAAGDSNAHKLSEVHLWVNDYHINQWRNLNAKEFEREVTIPAKALRRGRNLITMQAFNQADARRDAPVAIDCTRPEAKPNLFSLSVGVGDYKKAGLGDLTANVDAEAISKLLKKQEGKVFARTSHTLLKDGEVTRDKVLEQLRRVGREAGSDDLLVLFMGGHGTSDKDLTEIAGKRGVKKVLGLRPDTFVFATHDFNLEKPVDSGLTGDLIYEELRKLPCRKLILLDTCHSGTIGMDPVRQFAPSAVGPVILSACAPEQLATENKLLGLQYTQGRARGLFAIALILAMEDEFDAADRNTNNKVDVVELSDYLQKTVPELLRTLDPKDRQDPRAFLPALERQLDLAQK